MRNILFRAKRTDNGEWVEGSLIDSGNHEQVMIYPHYDGASTMGVRQLVYYSSVPVDHDTVCEWTGLYDKSGKKIFEGDVLRFDDNDGVQIKNPDGYVVWSEVVGNVFDNPDLIDD